MLFRRAMSCLSWCGQEEKEAKQWVQDSVDEWAAAFKECEDEEGWTESDEEGEEPAPLPNPPPRHAVPSYSIEGTEQQEEVQATIEYTQDPQFHRRRELAAKHQHNYSPLMSEQDICHNLVNLLLGLPGPLFELTSTPLGEWTCALSHKGLALNCPHIPLNALKRLFQPFFIAAAQLRSFFLGHVNFHCPNHRSSRFIHTLAEADSSPLIKVGGSVALSVVHTLTQWVGVLCGYLSVMERRIYEGKERGTLIDLTRTLRPLLTDVRALHSLAVQLIPPTPHTPETRILASKRVIDVLWSELAAIELLPPPATMRRVHSVPPPPPHIDFEWILELFRETLGHYMSILSHWLLEGRVVDPHKETFLTRLKNPDSLSSNDDESTTFLAVRESSLNKPRPVRVCVDEMEDLLPICLRPLTDSIFECGDSVNFMTRVHFSLPEVPRRPSHIWVNHA